MLFSAVVEDICRTLDWDDKGILINGARLTNLRYADDLVLVSHRRAELQTMINELSAVSRTVGLLINEKKTVVMMTARPAPVLLNGAALPIVEEFVYLGHRVSFDGNPAVDLQRRIRSAWAAFNRHYDFFVNRNVAMKHKRRVYESCVEPAFLYSAETWILRQRDLSRLIVTQRKMMRRMVGVTLLDRRTNEWLANVVKLRDLRLRATHRKWNWARSLALMDKDRWAVRLAEWRPWTRRRQPGRPKQRWRDELCELMGEGWMRVAEDQPALWRSNLKRRFEMILTAQ